MTLHLTRGTVLVLFICLGAAATWSFRSYIGSMTLQRQGLAPIEKEKANQLTRQIAETRNVLQQSPDRKIPAGQVQQIHTQLTQLLDLAKQSKKISFAAARRASGSLWLATGFCLLALVMLSLSLQRGSRVATESDVQLKEETGEWAWQNVHQPSPAAAVEESHDAALRLAKEVYTLSSAPPGALILRLTALIQRIQSLSPGARRRLLYARSVKGSSVSMAEHVVNVTWMALLRGEAMGLEDSEMLDLGLAGFLHDLARVPLQQSPHRLVPPTIYQESAQLLERIPDLTDESRKRLQDIIARIGPAADGHPLAALLTFCDAYDQLKHPAGSLRPAMKIL